mmetsp:Transcript_28464/g.83558  ORF Transcript_28464/g.83558 Transcript_28464/m.83558 type:complete len:212 (-) Transcript_28464:167-802(-)
MASTSSARCRSCAWRRTSSSFASTKRRISQCRLVCPPPAADLPGITDAGGRQRSVTGPSCAPGMVHARDAERVKCPPSPAGRGGGGGGHRRVSGPGDGARASKGCPTTDPSGLGEARPWDTELLREMSPGAVSLSIVPASRTDREEAAGPRSAGPRAASAALSAASATPATRSRAASRAATRPRSMAISSSWSHASTWAAASDDEDELEDV